MSNFEASIIGALIGGGLAIATGILLRIYTDFIESRRLRVALATEIRAILGLIERDKLILHLEDLVSIADQLKLLIFFRSSSTVTTMIFFAQLLANWDCYLPHYMSVSSRSITLFSTL